ncbi:unnamed protein product, partial [Lymnaea stagnalis]
VHDKASSILFLQQHGIIHAVRQCANNHNMILSLNNRQDRWRCHHANCRHDIPIRQGTRLQ